MSPQPPPAGVVFAEDGTFAIDRAQVGSCFGCGQQNVAGLRLRFRLLDDGAVATTVEVPALFCGVDGVVHGGIQATILDEVSGVAAQLALPEGSSTNPCVTADLNLSFRRPVPQTRPVHAEARVTRVEGRSFHIDARILGEDGEAATRATSRWVQLRA